MIARFRLPSCVGRYIALAECPEQADARVNIRALDRMDEPALVSPANWLVVQRAECIGHFVSPVTALKHTSARGALDRDHLRARVADELRMLLFHVFSHIGERALAARAAAGGSPLLEALG